MAGMLRALRLGSAGQARQAEDSPIATPTAETALAALAIDDKAGDAELDQHPAIQQRATAG
jgi:hypothetical protein